LDIANHSIAIIAGYSTSIGIPGRGAGVSLVGELAMPDLDLIKQGEQAGLEETAT
jgi:hypothetical protein